MTVVPSRPCGRDGLTLPALALGSWHTWDRTPFEETVRVLERAIEAGATLFDVGVYRAMGPGTHDSPTDLLFARALQLSGAGRDAIRLSIKGWLGWPHEVRPLAPQVDEALTRLGTDHADVLVLGDVTQPDEYDPERVAGELADLVRAGKVLHWGVNNWSADEIETLWRAADAAGAPGPLFAQTKYGIARRSVTEGPSMRGLIERTGLAIQASASFEGGLLLGRGDERMIVPDVGGIQEAVRAAVPALRGIAEGLGATLPQLAAAFPLTNPAVANLLVGVRTVAQLDEVLGAFALLERHGAEAIRAALDDHWLDAEAVAEDSSWSYAPGASGFTPA